MGNNRRLKTVCGEVHKYGTAKELVRFYNDLAEQSHREKDHINSELYKQHAYHYERIK